MSLITAGTYIIGAWNIVTDTGLGRHEMVRHRLVAALEEVFAARREASYRGWSMEKKLQTSVAVDCLMEAHAALTDGNERRLLKRLEAAEMALDKAEPVTIGAEP
jgi:hypothetical protein